MAECPGPTLYTIAAHRGFADALVAGLIPRYSEPEFGLARLTLLLPNRRAERIVTEAFVRALDGGLLLPRMAVLGELDLDETLGPLLDPLGGGLDIPPAADPVRRWFRLADLLRDALGDKVPDGAGLLRLAQDTARGIDRLAVEGLALDDLLQDRIVGIVGDLAGHWQESIRLFAQVHARWQSELAQRGEVDLPERRNRLFERAARRWSEQPPDHPVVAAGITSASPAIAALLRVIANLPKGAVVLPDLDLALNRKEWDALGRAGVAPGPDEEPFGTDDAVTHPQYHLKLLLNRIGVSRDEVQPWHRSGFAATSPDRGRAISNLFLPAEACAAWVDLSADQRRLTGLRLMESANPEEEAQAIAILVRQALEQPGLRVSVITPDRNLAARIVANLSRWNIQADDSAGRPLSQTPAGRLLSLIAELAAQDLAPVPLIALLGHPLVKAGEERAAWLDQVRKLDLGLRGPRPAPGLAHLHGRIEDLARKARDESLATWFGELEPVLHTLLDGLSGLGLAEMLDRLTEAAERLCGSAAWSGNDGRALAQLIEELRGAAGDCPVRLSPRDLPLMLRDAMDRIAVRPSWGAHPRVAIYGLLEARLSRADLMICAGLTEGTWPSAHAPEQVLPPAVLRALGVPGSEFRIGLSAHDLAGALGAPEVVMSWAVRDASGPVIPSRFVLRVQAMLGSDLRKEVQAVDLARAIDLGEAAPPYPRPEPRPSPAQRDVALAVTAIDRLRGDPYQFYASTILRLRKLDGLDAEPTAAWKGTVVHDVLQRWHQSGGRAGELLALAAEALEQMQAHPLVRSLWWPRLARGLEWIDAEIVQLGRVDGRAVLASEIDGTMTFAGVKVFGRADRIDRTSEGGLVVVDYKTGSPPRNLMVEQGFALQLGVIGLIARAGGFAGIEGTPDRFEYWSLGKSDKSETGFGYRREPIKEDRVRNGMLREEVLDRTEHYLADAIGRWIKGSDAFTARLNPDLDDFNDYDQLMRLDEWQARASESET